LLNQTFDASYFAHCCGVPYRRDDHWLTFFGRIADHIVSGIQPRTVLDAGCALGILVEALRERGADARGIDISPYAIANVFAPVRPYCREGSIAEELPDRYDLIVSIEVLEHMPAEEGEATIANFCRHSDDVLFSSTPRDHGELSHVNVQPAEYWAERFARHGFYRDVDFDASFLTPWAVRFRRSAEPLTRIVRNYERRYAALSESRNDVRAHSTEMQRDLTQVLGRLSAVEAERDILQRADTQLRTDLQQAIAQLQRSSAAAEAERDILQQAIAQLQRSSGAAEAERAKLSQENAQVAALRESVEQSHANLTRKIVALEASERQVASLNHQVAHGQQTIALMEQSIFWRLRLIWVKIARPFRRKT
jgi:SAM-dependent methyltransferase